MKKALIILAASMAMSGLSAMADDFKYDVIPMPKTISMAEKGHFQINAKTKITFQDASLMKDAAFLAEFIQEETGQRPEIKEGSQCRNSIDINIDKNLDPEGYRMEIGKNGVRISAGAPAGVFYAAQTLRKSLAVTKELPAATIEDAPEFHYRGAHFDVSRHFFTVDEVKTYLDMMALHNMNTFHWHLTDDQGWRIEIKKYPRLHEIGSVRKETLVGHAHAKPHVYDGKPYGGYYTQDQILDVIKYAAERHIEIIPEIDLPGHMMAALAAYPELGCTGGPYEVWTKWGISKDVLCAGNPLIYEFLDNVMKEVVALFPSKYIHIGGDECPKDSWKKCPKCQAEAEKLGLTDDEIGTKEQKLQNHIMKHVADYLANYGRNVIGWDEILEGEAAPGATIMSWRGEKGGIAAAKKGHDVIMTPNTYLYFDYYQREDTDKEPLAIGGFLPLEKVYSYKPMPDVLTPAEAAHIIGVQANLWTEYVETFSHAQYMVLPRWSALSEIQWRNPEKRDFESFKVRLRKLATIYDLNNYNYAKTF